MDWMRKFLPLPAGPALLCPLAVAQALAAQASGPAPPAPPARAARPAPGALEAQQALASARAFITSGQPGLAIPFARDYARCRPSDPAAFFWLGLAFEQAGDPGQAIRAYSRSLDLAMESGMDSAQLRLDIGNVLLRLRQVDDAIFNYRRALEIDARQARAYFNLGRAYLEKGDATAALENLNRSYELGLDDAALAYFRGLAYRRLGKPGDARAQLELFLRTLPETEANEGLRERVRAMAGQP